VRADDLISVIVPARNVERFVGRALASVLGQSHRDLEVIVVDDGSVDRTAAVVEAVAERDARVRLIRTENIGVSAARNLAIANSRGELIASLDADDIWRDDKLARQLAVMRAGGPDVGIVYCWSAGIDEHDRIILPTWNNSSAAGNVLRDIVVSGIAGNGSTPLMRRKYVEAVGGYDAQLTLCEDWKFYTALAGVCEFAVVAEYLTGYRLHLESASLDVLAMEQAIDGVTRWIAHKWPWLPESVWRDRSYTVDAYLAFLAIRQREFFHALRYLARALRARPGKLFALSYVQLYALLAAHAIGLRRYRWLFWKQPSVFVQSIRADQETG
jgi:glycosyltransferase involved in cell wall biosynthesis